MRDHPHTEATQAIRRQLQAASGPEAGATGGPPEIRSTDANLAAQRVNQLHREVLKGLQDIGQKAIAIGGILDGQKKTLRHGEWLDWINQHLTIRPRQAENYLRIYRRREVVQESMKRLAQQGLTPSIRKMLLAASQPDTPRKNPPAQAILDIPPCQQGNPENVQPRPWQMIFNADCRKNRLPDEIADLGLHDPPFGIGESRFGRQYNRKESLTYDGYVEAPADYYGFSKQWMSEAVRVLKPDGSMYIVSGWSQADIIGRVIRELGLCLINKIIWTYPFGVYAKRKFVSAHYEIFYLKKHRGARPTFNTDCRFATTQQQYTDMQSVWHIPRDYKPGRVKNKNQLPAALVRKMVQYASHKGDIVCDFFAGSFVTRDVCVALGRHFMGYELNTKAAEAAVFTADSTSA